MDAGEARGLFLWNELLTTDPERAADFYARVVGWGVEAWEDADPPYWMLVLDGEPRAGLMELPQDAREAGVGPHWLAYVGVPDVDAAAAEAVTMGAASLVPPRAIPSVGRVAVLRDPEGADFALYAPEDAEAARPGSAPGTFTWHELATTNLDGSFDFYSALVGWTETQVFDMGEMGPYRTFGTGDVELGGFYRMPKEQLGPPAWLAYVRVDDVEAAAARVEEGGGRVVSGPMEVPGGDVVAPCADPQGADFALHEVRGGGGAT